MDNDEGTQDRWREIAEECWEQAEADNVLSKGDRAEVMLADMLKDEIEEANPLAGTCTMYSDILTANLKEVDYIEIAHNLLEDVDKDDEDEETTKGGAE